MKIGEHVAASRAQTFAAAVYKAVTVLRGYTRYRYPPWAHSERERRAFDAAHPVSLREKIPNAVRLDIFAMLARHDDIYSSCFARGCDPEATAKIIQERDWRTARLLNER